MLQSDNAHDGDDFRQRTERLRSALVSQPELLQASSSAILSPEARARIHRALRAATHEDR
jgi:hypothetical protein